jgi:hypothetical protein
VKHFEKSVTAFVVVASMAILRVRCVLRRADIPACDA